MKISELLTNFVIYTSIEEQQILEKLEEPVKLSRLSEHDQFRVQAMIRKSLVVKIGMDDPIVVKNKDLDFQ
jgi:hypothetical protein